MAKRAAPQEDGTLIKRARSSEPEASNQQQLQFPPLVRSVKRTSNLEAPIVSLSGAHGAEILSSCSADRGICASRPYFLISVSVMANVSPNLNYGLLSTIHKAPVLDLQWSLFSPFSTRVRKLRAHREIINSLDRTLAGGAGVELLASASDDGTEPVAVFELGCPVTSVAWSADGATIYAGALDNVIHVLDLRKQEEISVLSGHVDTPTGLAISPNGSYLLSPSFSSQVIIHDIRPFAPSPNRVHRVLSGAPAGFENTLLRGAWSREDGGRRVAVGVRTVPSKILYKVCCVIFLDSIRHDAGFVAVVAWAQGYRHS
ncbi:WD40-repeat-containing domain protein, partial [Russula aff. rugulosa BPL654]